MKVENLTIKIVAKNIYLTIKALNEEKNNHKIKNEEQNITIRKPENNWKRRTKKHDT